MGDKQQRAALCNRGKGRGEVKGSSERSPSEEKGKTNGIVGMGSIWFYCLSGKVQERGIAKGEALHFYEEAIELHFLPWDGSIHSQSAPPATPSNQITQHQIILENTGKSLGWVLLPVRGSQSPEHCMAGAGAAPGQGGTPAPPPVGSCLPQGRCSGTEPQEMQQWGFVLACPTCRTHQPAWTQMSTKLFIQTWAEDDV